MSSSPAIHEWFSVSFKGSNLVKSLRLSLFVYVTVSSWLKASPFSIHQYIIGKDHGYIRSRSKTQLLLLPTPLTLTPPLLSQSLTHCQIARIIIIIPIEPDPISTLGFIEPPRDQTSQSTDRQVPNSHTQDSHKGQCQEIAYAWSRCDGIINISSVKAIKATSEKQFWPNRQRDMA